MATRNVGLAALCGPGELDSVARNRTDFELLCRAPLRNVSKSLIPGSAHENVLCVQVRSVYLSEVEDWSFNHRVTPITSCLLCTVCSKVIHVVWCCTKVLRPWVHFGPGICVSRSLQSFGEATRLPRMPVGCRSVPVRRFWCRYLAMMESCVSTSVAALHLVSFLSHHIHLHVRSVSSHAASLFPSYGGCVCASRGGLESACDWASVRGAWICGLQLVALSNVLLVSTDLLVS